MDCNFHRNNKVITIIFGNKQSEPLVFDFDNDSIDGFCKWNGSDINEFYRILDLFIGIKPSFRTLQITDDEGLWEEYVAQNKPCKVQLRPLVGEKENQLLKKAIENTCVPLDKTEQAVFTALRSIPTAPALCRLIVQDFIKILNLKSQDDFDPEAIVAFTNKLAFANDHLGEAQERIFESQFTSMMLQIWISHAFSYGRHGIISHLPNNIRGLKSSKLAALFGTMSIFLNLHSGVVNGKHAEMNKIAALHYPVGPFGEVQVSGSEKTELEFFVSMMDYLQFKYVGGENINSCI